MSDSPTARPDLFPLFVLLGVTVVLGWFTRHLQENQNALVECATNPQAEIVVVGGDWSDSGLVWVDCRD